jgi:type IV pilus assembly protein PilM
LSPGSLRSGGLALDIGASSVGALRLSGGEGRVKLRDYFEAPLPDGLVVDGEIVDADLLARELKPLVKRWGLRGRAVQVGVSNQKVIVRNIEMPEMTEEEIRGALEYQAQDYIPIPLEDAVIDFQVLGPRVGSDGARRLEVLLVAAQRQMIETLLESLRQCGLKVAGIDICALALVRALLPQPSALAGLAEPETCRGIVDVSSSVSTLAVAQGGTLRFSRVINFSSDRFARSVSEQRGIPLSDALMLVEQVGLEGPGSMTDDVYSPEVRQETQRLLGRIAAELIGDIKRSFDYYQSQEHGMPVSELILSGRGALVPNLDVHLGDALRIPVRIADPLVRVAHNASRLSDAELARIAPCLSVLIGLALPEDD